MLKNLLGYSLLLFGVFFGVLIAAPIIIIALIVLMITIQSFDVGADLIAPHGCMWFLTKDDK